MSARAERALVIAVLAVRATFVAQLVVAAPDGAARAGRPVLFVALALAMVLESVLLGAFLVHRATVTRVAALVDLAFVTLMILAEPSYSAAADRVGTWVAWGFGAGAAGALATGVGLRRLRHVVGGGLVLVAAYLVVSLPSGRAAGAGWTALTNSLALVGFALGAWVTARFVRDLAATADDARAEAAELARRAAIDRQRLLLHDQATVLSLLSRPGLGADVESVLRKQASLGSRRILAFLAREELPADGAAGGADVSLTDVVCAVAEEFGDLPLTVNVDLAVAVRVTAAVAHALADAVRTLLHNVRTHAHATAVTVHADCLPQGAWEVSVQDDGIGFDPGEPYGFGLQVQAGSALRAAGMRVTIDSASAEGTKVTIVGTADGQRS